MQTTIKSIQVLNTKVITNQDPETISKSITKLSMDRLIQEINQYIQGEDSPLGDLDAKLETINYQVFDTQYIPAKGIIYLYFNLGNNYNSIYEYYHQEYPLEEAIQETISCQNSAAREAFDLGSKYNIPGLLEKHLPISIQATYHWFNEKRDFLTVYFTFI